MSLIENLRGRGEGDEPGGGKFNPFRILEIGESMIRYCDGIRVKNYNFLAILTNERLVLIEGAQQNEGTIAKEIPVSMIKGAEMERDEKNRPALAMSMEVGGQTRLMKLVFTGIIDEPETECREWFTAINGYPPEPQMVPELKFEVPPIPVQEPAQAKPVPVSPPAPSLVIDAEAPPDLEMKKTEMASEPVKPDPVSSPAIQHKHPEQVPSPVAAPVFVAPEVPVAEPSAPVTTPVVPPTSQVTTEKIIAEPKKEQLRKPVPSPGGDSIQISIEKPDLGPVQLKRKSMVPAGGSGGKNRFCIHCGSRVPYTTKFCPVCGKVQV